MAPRVPRRFRWATVAVLGLLVAAIPHPAHAGEGKIDHVQSDADQVQILFSLPDVESSAAADLDSIAVDFDGAALDATAALAADEASPRIRRTTILAIDVSRSMRGERFAAAKDAAKTFLQATPADVYVGIVTFASEVQVAHPPSQDREAAAKVIDGLTLKLQTRLYDGVIQAVRAAGTQGDRSVLVLSDGMDTSDTPVASVSQAIRDAELRVDVIALAQSAASRRKLAPMAAAGEGTVIRADEPAALEALYTREAEALARQVLVTAPMPKGFTGGEGTLQVTLTAAGEEYVGSAFVRLAAASKGPSPLMPSPSSRFSVTQDVMLIGLAVAAVAVAFLLLTAFGAFGKRSETLEERIAAYSREGTARAAAGTQGTRLESQGLQATAVGVAQRAFAGNEGLENRVGGRLEAAGLSVKPAEWLLIHAGIAFGVGLLALLLSSGGILATTMGLFLGLALPWLYLSFRQSRRLKKFNGQLADTLQLMAGSLRAGLSLAQSVDTVVREGNDPISTEFKRALVESRLGVDIEVGLESVAARMQSKDFEWVVMAVRIQREVGGNLAELMDKVAETMREREYLRRQVRTLSAEGRLSAWILGGLPPVFVLYLTFANPGYLAPLVTTLLGWMMVGMGVVLMAVGVFWLSRVAKVEV